MGEVEMQHSQRELVCRGTGLLMHLFSFPLRELPKLADGLINISAGSRGTASAPIPFYLFGAFDSMLLTVSKDISELNRMRKAIPASQTVGIMDFFIHSGLVVATYPNDFYIESAIQECPIVGAIVVKLRGEVWPYVANAYAGALGFADTCNVLFQQAVDKTMRDSRLPQRHCKAMLLLSYDYEDAIVVLFTRSFEFVKRFATNLRSLEFDDLVSPAQKGRPIFRHAVVSTVTHLGVHLAKSGNAPVISWGPVVGVQERLSWRTMVQVKPGHLQYAINSIQGASRPGVGEPVPVVGRNDVMIDGGPPKLIRVSDFLQRHFEFVSVLVRNRSILSTETHLSFPGLKKLESKKAPRKMLAAGDAGQSDYEGLLADIDRKKALQEFEREAFKAILRKLRSVGEDPYLRDNFARLAALTIKGISAYARSSVQERLNQPGPDMWIGYVELAFASRFLASPPVGETATCATLGRYAPGLKILVLLDDLAALVIRELSLATNLPELLDRKVVTLSLNCFTAGCASFSQYGSSFITLFSGLFFHPQLTYLAFFHELGHAIADAYLQSKAASRRINQELNSGRITLSLLEERISRMEEYFAETISAAVVSGLDCRAHLQLTKDGLAGTDEGAGQVSKRILEEKQRHIRSVQKIMGNLDDLKLTAAGRVMLPLFRGVQEWSRKDSSYLRGLVRSTSPLWDFWELWMWQHRINGQSSGKQSGTRRKAR